MVASKSLIWVGGIENSLLDWFDVPVPEMTITYNKLSHESSDEKSVIGCLHNSNQLFILFTSPSIDISKFQYLDIMF